MTVSSRFAPFRRAATALPASLFAACCPAPVIAPPPELAPPHLEPAPAEPHEALVEAEFPPELELTPSGDVPGELLPDAADARPSPDTIPETGARHEVTPFTTTLSVKVGDLITHTFARHPSVGRDATARAGGRAVTLLRRDDIMKHPDRQDMPGGDASSSTWVFKAVARGTATLRIEHLFRGDVEHRIEVAVTVE